MNQESKETSAKQFVVENFYGAVMLKEWWFDPETGETYRNVVGTVSIIEDSKVAGFRVRGGESNWVARVVGPSGMAVTILGCQIRAVTALPQRIGPKKPATTYLVP